MNIFRFFSKNSIKNSPDIIAESIDPMTENNENETMENNADTPNKDIISISYGTGLPIDIIYGYIRKNYSEQGFQDAMANPDIAFKAMLS